MTDSSIGILALEIYTPRTYVSQTELEEYMGVPAGKYTAGLGQQGLALTGDAEDINSVCLTAVHALLEKYNIEKSQIGRLEVGTETLVDKSKSTKTVLMQLFDHTDIEGATVVNACYGGTSALLNAVAWCHAQQQLQVSNQKNLALVVAADIATYAAGPARPTCGVGAVAVLVGPDAPLVLDWQQRATHAAHVWDFFKPNPATEYPVVQGALSQTCYYQALEDVYERWCERCDSGATAGPMQCTTPDYWVFHAPYNKLVQKSFGRLFYVDALRQHALKAKEEESSDKTAKEEKKDSETTATNGVLSELAPWLEKERNETYTDKALEKVLKQVSAMAYKEKLADSNHVSQHIGNTYTASVFVGICSLISRRELQPDQHIAVFSYGSGALATLYTLKVREPNDSSSTFTLAKMQQVLNLQERLDSRERVAAGELDLALDCRAKLHGCHVPYRPLYPQDRLFPGTYYLTRIDSLWRRTYARVPTAATLAPWDGIVRPLKPPSQIQSFQEETDPTACYITGIAAGLPGQDEVFQAGNIDRLLNGDNLITSINPPSSIQAMLDKNMVVVNKQQGGKQVTKEPLTKTSDMIQLAAQLGSFNLTDKYGVPAGLAQTMDVAAQVAVGAGLEAMKNAGLVSGATNSADDWKLAPALQADTGVVYASSFPAMDAAIGEVTRYFAMSDELGSYRLVNALRKRLLDVQGSISPEDENALQQLMTTASSSPDRENEYTFDRKFLFRVLVLGNAQLAQLTGCRGPNTQTNAACAGTTQAIAMAQDMLISGRAARVVVIAGDNAAGPTLMPWLGSGFRVLGAATCQSKVEEAALPFDKRRSGMLLGAGAIGFVLETAASVRQRQFSVSPDVRLLATQYSNSAFHGAALDRTHIGNELARFLQAIQDQHGITKQQIARKGVYFSHETCTHATDESSCAGNEVAALRYAFGDDLSDLLILNTKGFTGHPMGVSFEDVTAVAVLQQQRVPKLPNHHVFDDYLGPLKLSQGGPYECDFALRFAAGFGSQVAFALYVRV